MKWIAVATAGVAATFVATTLSCRKNKKPPQQTLVVAVPIEQTGHRAPSLIEVWRGVEDTPHYSIRGWYEGQDEPAWTALLPHEIDWDAQSRRRPPLLRAGGVVVVPVRDVTGPAALVAVDLTTGRIAWHTPMTSRGLRWETVSAYAGLVVAVARVSGDKTTAAAVKAADGKLMWQTELTGDDHRVAFQSDFVVFASSGGAIAVDVASGQRHELTKESGDIVGGGGRLLFVGRSISSIQRRGGSVALSPVSDAQFPEGTQRETLAACGGMVVRVASKGRGLIALPYQGTGRGWTIGMDKDYDVLHAGASMSRWPVVRVGWPETRFMALWIDMGFKPKRGRLATVDCAAGKLRWVSGARSPDLVKPPRLLAGHYYFTMSVPGGGERAPAGFAYPPDPIAVIDGTSGRLASAIAVAKDQQRGEPINPIVPWRMQRGYLYQDTATSDPWSVNPRNCKLGPSRTARTCVSVLPMVHQLLGLPPPTTDR